MNSTLRNTIIFASIGVLGYLVYMKYKQPRRRVLPAPPPTPQEKFWESVGVTPGTGEAKVWLIDQSQELGIDYGSATDPDKFKYVPEMNIAI
jgi:hypothetical protein